MTDGSALTAVYKIATPDRLDTLRESVAALKQTAPAAEAIVLSDDAELRAVLRDATAVDRVADAPQSLTASRNAGAASSERQYVAFFDDDAIPTVAWWPSVRWALEEYDAAAAGGPLVPRWETVEPRWLPRSYHWLIGCGPYYDRSKLVPNTYGSNLVVDADAFAAVSGFDESIGMGSGGVGQAAETDLCRRLREAGHRAVAYAPAAEVEHVIESQNVAPRAVVGRAIEQGRAKSQIGLGDRESTFLREEFGRGGTPRQRLGEVFLTGAVGVGYLSGRLNA